MASTKKHEPRRIGGLLLVTLICVAAWVAHTANVMREPLKLLLEWALLAGFVRRETHGWYRAVIAMVGCDVIAGACTRP